VLGRTSDAGDRCPTLLFVPIPKWFFFVYLKKDFVMKEATTISPELQRFMDLHKIQTISELLVIKDETLLATDGFGWRMLKEVLKLRQAI
jgi:hypothetical protein